MSIELWHGLQKGPVLDTFNTIVHEWNVQNPESKVVTKEYSDYGAPAKEGLEKPENEQPTLVLAPEYKTGDMLEALRQKKIIPVCDVLEKQKLEHIADIIKKTFGDTNVQLSCLPFNPACGILYINKEALRAIGRDISFVPKTIEELIEISKELVSKKIVEAGYTCAWPAAYLTEIPAAQQDIALVRPDNGKSGFGTYQFSTKWLIKHFEDLKDQVENKVFIYGGKKNDSMNFFVERKVAFFMQGSSHYQWIQNSINKSEKPFDVGFGAIPTLDKGQKEKYAFPLGGGAFWVLENPKTRKMIDGVKSFLSYLASKEIQKRWHIETACVPILDTNTLDVKEFHKKSPLHQAVMEQTVDAPVGNHQFGIGISGYAEARQRYMDLIEKILSPDTPKEAIGELLSDFDMRENTSLKNKGLEVLSQDIEQKDKESLLLNKVPLTDSVNTSSKIQ